MTQRAYFKIIKKWIEEPRRSIKALYGPRQVGKTAMVKEALASSSIPWMYVCAEDLEVADGLWLRKLWEEIRQKAKESDRKEAVIVIDEVQRVDSWNETVKREWETDTFNKTNVKAILISSASHLIQKGLTESLVGKFESMLIPHWSYREMKEEFGWSPEEYMWFGGYPGGIKFMENESAWKRYIKTSVIDTSISKDILLQIRIDRPSLLRKLFETGSLHSSYVLSLTQVQEGLTERGNLSTLSNYLGLLESTFLMTGLDKYTGERNRKRSSKPKFQLFNNGLFSAQSDKTFHEAKSDPQLWGHVFESAVGTHLLNSSYTEDFDLYYWFEKRMEVDFIVEKDNRMIVIEVKYDKNAPETGLDLFTYKFDPKSIYTVGEGGIPIEEFLLMKPTDLF